MTDRASFLAAIRQSPDDTTLRLVYADWLDEQGNEKDGIRAALIRDMNAMPAMSLGIGWEWTGDKYPFSFSTDGDREFASRIASLNEWHLLNHRDEQLVYYRGVIRFVSCCWSTWCDHGYEWLFENPVELVRLTTHVPRMEWDRRTRTCQVGGRPVREVDVLACYDELESGNSRRYDWAEVAPVATRWPTVREWRVNGHVVRRKQLTNPGRSG